MENLEKIKLIADPESWRLFSIRKSDPAFEVFNKKVLERDNYICHYCGFQAKRFQEVVNLDQNYLNNKLSNLVTACCFCSQCFFFENAGRGDYGGGVLIYMPELSQEDLNGLCHVLFCAMSNATDYRGDAQNIYRSLKLRAQHVDKIFGEGSSDPMLFGRIFIDLSEQDKKRIIEEALPSMRLLPSYAKFSKIVEAWSADSLEELSND